MRGVKLTSFPADYVELVRSSIFSKAEARMIIKTRKQHYARIYSPAKELKDFKKFITFETYILDQVQTRPCKPAFASRVSLLQKKILRRICIIYQKAIQKYLHNYQLLVSFFIFCKEARMYNEASGIVERILREFKDNEEFIKIAVWWLAFEVGDVASACRVLHTGLVLHPNSVLLYKDAVFISLKTFKSSNDQEACDKMVRRLSAYVLTMIKNDACVDDLIEVLELLQQYEFTAILQKFLIEQYFLKYHLNKAIVWHALAQREIKGKFPSIPPLRDGETYVARSISLYEIGLLNVQPEEKDTLIDYYLDHLISLKDAEPKVVNINDLLRTKFEKIYRERKYFSESHILTWISLIKKDDEPEKIGKTAVMKIGLQIHSSSEELWLVLLKSEMDKFNFPEVKKILKNAEENLGDQASRLYAHCIKNYHILGKEQQLEEVYLQGINGLPKISEFLKPKYVEWLSMTRNIMEARAAYDKIAILEPFSKALHLTMCKLESAELIIDDDHWKKVLELATEQFPRDLDVWEQYMSFYTNFNSDQFGEFAGVYHRALEALTPEIFLYQEFKSKYEPYLPRRPVNQVNSS